MYIAALTILAKNWKQLKFPREQQLTNLWYILRKVYRVTIKRNELHNMDESQKHCSMKEALHKRVQTILFQLHDTVEKTILMSNDRKKITACLRLSLGRNGWDGTMELFRVIEMLSI